MDPQKLSQLDSKLRDAYQRVMGTPILQSQTPPPPAGGPTPPMPDPTPAPPPQPEPQPPAPTGGPTPSTEEPPAAPQPAIPPAPEPAMPILPPAQSSNFVQMNSEVGAMPSQTIPLKKKNGIMMPILIGIAGLAFVAIYTLFWTKIFNFKLPFLP